MSKVKNDLVSIRLTLSKSIRLLFFFICPLMIFFMLNPEEIIIFLLTEKWIESAKFLKPLSLLGILFPIQMMNLNALKSVGRISEYLKITTLWNITSIITALITCSFNINLMIIGQVIVTLVFTIYNIVKNGEFYNYTFYSQFTDLKPLLLINFLLYVIIKILFDNVVIDMLLLSLIAKFSLLTLIYFLLNITFNKKIFLSIVNELKQN